MRSPCLRRQGTRRQRTGGREQGGEGQETEDRKQERRREQEAEYSAIECWCSACHDLTPGGSPRDRPQPGSGALEGARRHHVPELRGLQVGRAGRARAALRPDLELDRDDIQGIQALYGPPQDQVGKRLWRAGVGIEE